MTPLQTAAHDIGAKGSEPTEEERLAFEAWMRGHCWKVEGAWDGKQYVHAHESTGFVHGGAMNTRRLWAAWRDRGAVARVLAGQAQAVEPHGWMINGMSEVMSRGHAQAVQTEHQSMGGTAVAYPVYLHPAATGERAELIHWLRERSMRDGMLRLIDAANMLEADAKYDQQAMELCDACGWKAIMPGEPCFVCNMQTKQVAVPAGWALVPIEPTPEMSAAGFCVTEAEHDPAGVYRAMLAAAQGAKP